MRRPLHLFALGLAFAGLTLAAPAAAAANELKDGRGERIERLDVDMVLLGNGTLRVVETIVYNFSQNKRHGIFRDIPLDTYGGEIVRVSAARNNTRERVDFENTGQWLRIRIGSENTTVSGKQTYQLSYLATEPLAYIDNRDENAGGTRAVALSWDAIGDGWDVPIERSSVKVRTKLPFTELACTRGKEGTQTPCTRTEQGLFNTGTLKKGQGVTIYARLKSGHGLNLHHEKEPEPWEPTWELDTPSNAPPAGTDRAGGEESGGGEGPPTAVLLIAGILAGITCAVGGATALRPKLTPAVVQFEPPRGLTPLQLGAALNNGPLPAGSTIAGALLDLARRGWVTVSFDNHPTVTWKGNGNRELSPAETALCSALFKGQGGTTVLDDHYLQDQHETLGTVQQLAEDTVDIQRHLTPRRLRTTWLLASIGVLAAGPLLGALWIPLGGAALGGGFAMLATTSRIRTLQTPDELELQSQSEGFKRLLSTDAAQMRAAYAERTDYDPVALAATMLAYATVLEVPSQWLDAFDDIDPERVNQAAGVSGLGDARRERLLDLSNATSRAMRARRERDSSFPRGGTGTFGGVRGGRGFTRGRGFSGTRGAGNTKRSMGRRGGGRGGGGGGSW